MDSRDIKQEPTIDSQYLESMYLMQMGLIQSYIKIESLPQPPVDINTRKSQDLLKDFSARVIEELSEAFESIEEVAQLVVNNNYFCEVSFDVTSSQNYVMALNHLQNISEELSDAIHFYIELLIYANIQPDDIISYIKAFVKGVTIEESIFVENLYEIMATGKHLLSKKYSRTYGDHNVIDLLAKHTQEDLSRHKEHSKLMVFGNKVTPGALDVDKCILWDITHELNLARNFLKNKPWKQSQMMTQEKAFQSRLVRGFILLMGYLAYLDGKPEDVYYIYFKKNLVNQFRIQSKY